MDLPLLQLATSEASVSFVSFHVRNRQLANATIGVSAQYYHSGRDIWEPLMEYSSFRVEFASPEPLAASLHACLVPVVAPGVSKLVTQGGSSTNRGGFAPTSSSRAWLALRNPLGTAACSSSLPHGSHDKGLRGLRLSSGGALFALEDSILAAGLLETEADNFLTSAEELEGTKDTNTAEAAVNQRDYSTLLRSQMLRERHTHVLHFDSIGAATMLVADDDDEPSVEELEAMLRASAAQEGEVPAQTTAADPAGNGSARYVSPFSLDHHSMSTDMKTRARVQAVLMARRKVLGDAISAPATSSSGVSRPIQMPPFPHDPPYKYPALRPAASPLKRDNEKGASNAAGRAGSEGRSWHAVDIPGLPASMHLRLTSSGRVNINLTPAFINGLLDGYALYLQVR
jgi:hypothetical protein